MSRRDSILVSRSLYQIGVITLIAAVIWVGVGIYNATNKATQQVEIDKSILEPINPILDQEVIKALSGRIVIEGDLTVTPISTPSASEVSSESATINVNGVR